MTTAQWMLLDTVVAVLGIASWFASGVTAALRRYRLSLGLLIGAILVSLARVATVAGLSDRGWWFVQEKVLLGLPMLAVGGLAAALIAGPRLVAVVREPGERLPAAGVVALFAAGYAALAGLVVTFIAGYPLRWSAVLIAVAIVCAATVLTDQAVRSTPDSAQAPAPRSRAGFSRREFIGVGGAVAVGTGITGVGLLFTKSDSVVTGGGPGSGAGSRTAVSVADLRGPLEPAPGGTRRQSILTARTGAVRLASGQEVDAWTYNNQLPGPAITATAGDLIEVTLRNADIGGGVSLHWHGYDVPCGEDGAPGATQHAVMPGEEFVYRFRADQVGTYWYHTHQASHLGVRKGLYGTLVVTPRDQQQPEQLDLTLPVHTFDATVVLGDQEGRAVHTARPGQPVRLRLINTDSQPHWFALAGAAFRVLAVDGRDLHQPGELRQVGLRLPAGGRYDVALAMPDTPVALLLDHDKGKGVLLRPTGDTGSGPALPDDTSGWPELDLLRYGQSAAVPFDADNADRHFTMVLDRAVAMVNGRPAYGQTVNGRGHPSIPDQLVSEGDIVRFTVVNRGRETHPWHLHGHSVLILSRDGRRSTGSPLWVDTFDVRPGEVWEVAFQAQNPGIWMNHCHNLPHQDQGMMLRLVYDGVSTPFDHMH